MNGLAIAIGLIFLFGIIWGAFRGVIKVAAALAAAILSILLVTFLNPYVCKAIRKWTPLEQMIEEKCVEQFLPSVSLDSLAGVDLSGTPLAGYDLQELQDTDLSSLGLDAGDVAELLGEIPKDTQIRLIENADLPDFLKAALLENNNSEIYDEMQVKSFPEYVTAYVSDVVIRILAFVLTFVLVWILIQAFIAVTDLMSALPIIRSVDTIAGAVLGAVLALVFVWVFFLVLTLLCTTNIGKQALEMVNENAILSFIYEHNLFLNMLL